MNVIIMFGVIIGEGVIVVVGFVVSKDVLLYIIVGGNFVKEIKKWFIDIEINMLMEMCWFDWDRKLIEKVILLLFSLFIELLFVFYKNEVKNK